MEEHFLDQFVRELDSTAKKGSDKHRVEPWYNTHGDCIEFQTVDEGIIADRIDEYLTIYHSGRTNEPIGFQIKDVQALVKKYGFEGLEVQAAIKGKVLLSVSALLLSAYESLPASISRRTGYSSALRALPRPDDRVPIPAGVSTETA